MSFWLKSKDPVFSQVIRTAENAASSRASVLILGESGTGKELLARYIHHKSQRSQQKFVAINCAAIPEGLLEGELFGYEKGAFTGAVSAKIGKVEYAHQGTLLLDEIGDMPMVLQAKLLRVLQESEVDRLGSHITKKVDVRVIATTNKNLYELVNKGLFREDLLYRLNVVTLEIPPLRQRLIDLDDLAALFIRKYCSENNKNLKHLRSDSREVLLKYNWPGNVRELENAMEKAVVLSESDEIYAHMFEFLVQRQKDYEIRAGMTVFEAEKLLIMKTLEVTGQNRTHAASLLGISVRTLRNKLNEYKGESYESDI